MDAALAGCGVPHADLNCVNDIRFVRNSYYMVDLFFVLSGFVMNLNTANWLHKVHDLAVPPCWPPVSG